MMFINKETPKEPVVYTSNEFTDLDGNNGELVTYIECPTCGSDISDLESDTCDCGQTIKWND